MRNEKLGMSKKNSVFVLLLVICYLLSVLAACDTIADTPKIQTPVKSTYGKISIILTGGGAARTTLPSMAFDKYEYTFTKSGGSGVVKTPDDGLFTLETGNYTVAVKAFIGTAEPYTLAASGISSQFSVSSGSNTPVQVPLSGVDTAAQGKFTYTITWPKNIIEAAISLKKWPNIDEDEITLTPADVTSETKNGKTQTLQLGAGSYLLTVRISTNDLYAGINEAIHIYPAITTVYTKDFIDDDLLPFPSTPAADDYTIGNLNQTAGSVTAVTITPKTGKSTGTVTVYYEGTDTTTYAKSTTVPSAVGTYAVTFNVAAAVNWNGASGLSAGKLIITTPVFTSIADFGTWLAARPANTAATAYRVALNVSSLGGATSTSGNLGSILLNNYTNYVYLDLSGSTFTSIGSWAFDNCTSLTGITIPDNVTSIGNTAFQNCTSLTSITIPNSVTSIGSWAFSYCTKLASVTIGNSVTSIGYNAFSYCTSLASVTIGNSVTSIGSNAFSGCSELTSVTIPNSVTTIDYGAFSGCSGLTSITIPNSVTSIGDGAFGNCSGLNAINVDADNTAYSSRDGVLYNKNKTTLIQYPAGKAGAFTIPDSVTSIDFAFIGCSKLTSVTIPGSVKSIGYNAFYNCTSLTSVTIPNSVISIRYQAFSYCTKLASVTIGNSVTSIEDYAFFECGGLIGVYITDLSAWCKINFGDNPLYYAHNLYINGVLATSITIPNSVTSIGYGAFRSCTGLTSVTIPDSVTSIGDYAFRNCTSLTSVTFQGTIGSSRFNDNAFSGLGDLRDKYLAGGVGTYTRASGGTVWTKQ